MALTQISTAGVKDDIVTAAKIADDAVTEALISDDSVDEARLKISNAGSNGQFLSKQSGNTGGLTWATPAGGAGGATGLDLNDNVKIRLGTGNDLQMYHDGSNSYIQHSNTGSLKLMPTTGDIIIDNGSGELGRFTQGGDWELPDNGEYRCGTGDDLKIYHDGSHSIIQNSTGDLVLYTASGSIKLLKSSGGESMLQAAVDGAVDLYYDGNKRLETTSAGVNIGGNLSSDSGTSFTINAGGASGTAAHFIARCAGENAIVAVPNGAVELYYNNFKSFRTHENGIVLYGPEGGDGHLIMYADEGDDNADFWRLTAGADGNWVLYNYASGAYEKSLQATGNGNVELYYDNSKKIETESGGVAVTGGLTVTTNISLVDSGKIKLGAGDDLQLYHDGSTSIIYSNNSNISIRAIDGENSILIHPNAQVELFYNDVKKAETKAAGWQIHGTCYVDFENDVGGYGGQWNDASTNGTFIQFQKTGSNAGYISHSNTTASYNTTGSDRALKENFEDWTDSYWNVFKNSKPQKFNYKTDDAGTPKSRGYIAQDLTESFPEAYHKTGQEYYYFNPGGMVPYLMKTLQEAIIEIDTLKTKVAALEAA